MSHEDKVSFSRVAQPSRYIRKEFVVNEQEEVILQAFAVDLGLREATLFRFILLQAEKDYRHKEDSMEHGKHTEVTR